MAKDPLSPHRFVSMLGWPEQGNGQAPSSLLPSGEAAEIQIRDLCLSYGGKPALQNISMDIARCQVTAFIGPSGCGKSTLIRCLNRLTTGLRTPQSLGTPPPPVQRFRNRDR